MPAISAYSAIFLPTKNVAQLTTTRLYMRRCVPMCVLYGPSVILDNSVFATSKIRPTWGLFLDIHTPLISLLHKLLMTAARSVDKSVLYD